MDIYEILKRTDHTLLSPSAVMADYERLCEEAAEFGAAAVCVPPCRVRLCARLLRGRVKVCTVAGFPCGYNDGLIKAYEASAAIADGADEIDMVINIGMVKERDYAFIADEIHLVRHAVAARVIKVIIETSMLTDDEKRELCAIISDSGADYVKTSTGFGGGGATVADVALLKRCLEAHVKVKASGGIASLEDAAALIEAGADRLGSSKLVALARAAMKP